MFIHFYLEKAQVIVFRQQSGNSGLCPSLPMIENGQGDADETQVIQENGQGNTDKILVIHVSRLAVIVLDEMDLPMN